MYICWKGNPTNTPGNENIQAYFDCRLKAPERFLNPVFCQEDVQLHIRNISNLVLFDDSIFAKMYNVISLIYLKRN